MVESHYSAMTGCKDGNPFYYLDELGPKESITIKQRFKRERSDKEWDNNN
jgi:hypothetical protein